MVWDPAEGLAIARCQAARFRDRDHRTTTDHPSTCQWCAWPDDELGRLVESFNSWAKWNERARAYDSHECRVFREQPADVQRAQITAAQELTGEPWPPVDKSVEESMPTPPDAVDERPSWA